MYVSGGNTHTGLKLLYGPSHGAHGSSTFENKTITKYSSKIQPEGMISVRVQERERERELATEGENERKT